ncbi:sensor histidine kinase [Vallitalea sediminicola]
MKNIVSILLRKFNIDLKISFKLIVFSIVISTIPLFFISIVFDNKIQKYYSEKLNESYEQVVSQYVSNLNYKIELYQTFLNNISSNQNINDLLLHKNNYTNSEVYDVGKRISNEVGLLIGTKNIEELRNIMVYFYDEELPIYSSKFTNVEKVKDEDWYIEIHNDIKKGYLFYNINNYYENVLSLYKQIIGVNNANYGQKLGFTKLDINTDDFFRIKNSFNDETEKNIYVIDENETVVWGSKDKNLSIIGLKNNYEVVENEIGNKYIELAGEKKLLFYKTINKYGWKVIFLFDNNIIGKYIVETRKAIATYLIILIFVMTSLIIIFSKKFSGRIGLIIKKMEKVENGDLNITNKIEGNDEISILDMHFNEMVYRLEEQINNNYVQKLERREAELNALQFQINPHFLYNTLESINSLAAINECYEICEISHKLGEMFRYSVNKDSSEYVSLDNEIKHIKNYIYIQRIRFKDSFEVFYNIDNYTKQLKILKFILQPIVENAIIHGFRNKKGNSCLEISAYIENNKLYIKVIDDGNGMSKDQIQRLNSYINEREDAINCGYKKSIGVKNVNKRIQLSCGNEYGLNIESKQNFGTQVIITLPINQY